MLILSYAVKKALSKHFPSRQEGKDFLQFIDYHEFKDLERSKFEFFCEENKLVGYRYFSTKYQYYKGLVVFFHGFGAGHDAYITQIFTLADRGFLVYAFDHTTCGESEGEGFFAFSQSLVDQRAFFEFLDQDPAARGLKRYACGHSWGGYTAICSLLNPKYGISKVVSMSGFNSPVDIYSQRSEKMNWFTRMAIKITLFRYFGKFGNVEAVKILEKTDKDVLIIFGDKDETVPYDKNYMLYKKATEGKPNIKYLTVPGRAHQPYSTQMAQDYYYWILKKHEEVGTKNMPEIDYLKLIEEDPFVVDTIYKFLEGTL